MQGVIVIFFTEFSSKSRLMAGRKTRKACSALLSKQSTLRDFSRASNTEKLFAGSGICRKWVKTCCGYHTPLVLFEMGCLLHERRKGGFRGYLYTHVSGGSLVRRPLSGALLFICTILEGV